MADVKTMNARASVQLRERAEAAFTPERARLRPAPAMPVRPVCDALMPEWSGVKPNIQTCAWRIASLRTLEDRQQVWIEVLAMWQDDVRHAVALLLAEQYGHCGSWVLMYERIRTEVPADLQDAVRDMALVIYRRGRG